MTKLPSVLHLHEADEIYGGAEVYIQSLHSKLPEYGYESYWLAISSVGGNYTLRGAAMEKSINGTRKEIIDALYFFINRKGIVIINIHTLLEPEIVAFCLTVRPVVKFSHSPVMVCPGRDKFWRRSERICDIKYGFHCFYHIYSEGCSSRHPARVLRAWNAVNFEINEATKKYRKIVVMSDYIQQGLIECGVPRDKIVVNPYFTEWVEDKSVASAANGQKRILFMGRLASSKGPHVLLSAVGDILKRCDDVFLDIVGDGSMLDQLKNQVNAEGLANKVLFHGWKERNEIKDLLSASYIVAFPSIYPEAFGIVGIEAMMYGKPVVGFDVGGVSTWLDDNRTGFLVKSGDKDLMRYRIQQLIADSALYSKMAGLAREVAMDRFLPAVHINRICDVYQHCLS